MDMSQFILINDTFCFDTLHYCIQCSCWSLKSSGHFPNFTTFTITMIAISNTFQYKIVLKIFKVQAICEKFRQWPMAWREQEQCWIYICFQITTIIAHVFWWPPFYKGQVRLNSCKIEKNGYSFSFQSLSMWVYASVYIWLYPTVDPGIRMPSPCFILFDVFINATFGPIYASYKICVNFNHNFKGLK